MKWLLYATVLGVCLIAWEARSQTVPDPDPANADPTPLVVTGVPTSFQYQEPTVNKDGVTLAPAEKLDFVYIVISDESGNQPVRIAKAATGSGTTWNTVAIPAGLRGKTAVKVFAHSPLGTGLVRQVSLQYAPLNTPGKPNVQVSVP